MEKKPAVDGLLRFIQSSPTPFHAVAAAKALLTDKGFQPLEEHASWNLKPGTGYFLDRGASSLIAFRLGESPERDGFRIAGAHTDSPCLKLKPHAAIEDRTSLRLGVEVYGSPLLATWFDRDLSLAGRVFYSDGKKAHSVLVDFARPVAVVPNLAIHLNRSANENRTIQKQTELPPLVALDAEEKDFDAALMALVQSASGSKAKSILSHELSFYDTQAPSVLGLNHEFVASARLDNLLSCYAGLMAITQAKGTASSVVVLNDHEEVGSSSAVGAQGPFLRSVLERLCGADAEKLTRALSHSILFSTDNAHGVHPAHPDKHDPQHRPLLNAGPAIKTNWSQRYATTAETAAFAIECFQAAGVKYQQFVSRNDMPCGSTIGPITASVLGIKTVDVGVPTFAMHSIRELAGTQDALALEKTLVAAFQHPGWK